MEERQGFFNVHKIQEPTIVINHAVQAIVDVLDECMEVGSYSRLHDPDWPADKVAPISFRPPCSAAFIEPCAKRFLSFCIWSSLNGYRPLMLLVAQAYALWYCSDCCTTPGLFPPCAAQIALQHQASLHHGAAKIAAH